MKKYRNSAGELITLRSRVTFLEEIEAGVVMAIRPCKVHNCVGDRKCNERAEAFLELNDADSSRIWTCIHNVRIDHNQSEDYLVLPQ